jgi:hypothetical protein
MKLSEIKIGTDYATVARGVYPPPKRVRALEIGEYETERVIGRAHRDHRGGSSGPPTERVMTRGVRVAQITADGEVMSASWGDKEWMQANQIAATWEDHLKARAEAKRSQAAFDAERLARQQELQAALACLGEALRDHGIEFHGEIGHVFAVGTRVQVAFTPDQAIALAELIREREV